ncbi:hypothetical protein Acsp03_52980 [Actinomadura sp. NBRC 104412]|nr:hypothetical protein Acsp03_52980 [Actinomadura sp. NBRC 104412]
MEYSLGLELRNVRRGDTMRRSRRAEVEYTRMRWSAKGTGLREAEGWALDGLGVCARAAGDMDRAGRYSAEALGIAIQVGNREGGPFATSAAALATPVIGRARDLYPRPPTARGTWRAGPRTAWASGREDGRGKPLSAGSATGPAAVKPPVANALGRQYSR